MQSNGIIRRVDSLGRVTLTIEDRRALGIDEKKRDFVEMVREGEAIIVKKHHEGCIICGNSVDLKDIEYVNEKIICKKCMKEIKKIG